MRTFGRGIEGRNAGAVVAGVRAVSAVILRARLIDEILYARRRALRLHSVRIGSRRRRASRSNAPAGIAGKGVRLLAKGTVLAEHAVDGRVGRFGLVEGGTLDRTLGVGLFLEVRGRPLRVFRAFLLEEAE